MSGSMSGAEMNVSAFPVRITGAICRKAADSFPMCRLRTFPHRRVAAHSRHQCFERTEVTGDRRSAEPVVERVLSRGALGAIECCEDRVQVQVGPGAIVERAGAGRMGESRAMAFFNHLELAVAFDRLAPPL